jgi:DNA polymerase-3 subunit gamma/tau
VTLALYRKYRPARFADVVGQEHVTAPLRTALETGRINHAYLFSGPRGCGKTSSARILARSLNCVQGPTPDPCGECASCVALAPEGPGNIDVIELDAASHGGVDDTRELRDRAFFAPAESRYRVFIVDEAHMVSTAGFNALLKIVEEPPEHLIFVFATTEPEKVLPTIRSRTHHYPFRLIPPGTMRKLLERVCADEGATVAPAVFPLVMRAGGGSVRDSLSVLDQLLAGAGPDGVTYSQAVALLGVTDVALIDDVVDALAAGDRAAVFEAVDRLVEAGLDPRRFAADLLQRLRDLTLLQAIPDAAERGLVDLDADEVERMAEQAAQLGPATLVRYGEIVHAGLIEMRGATAPRLLLELLCARMLLPAASTAEPALLERLERLERREAIAPAPVPHGATAAAPPPEPGATESAAARRMFVRASRSGGEPAPEQDAAPASPAVRAPAAAPAPDRGAVEPSAVDRAVATTPAAGADERGAVAGSPAGPGAPATEAVGRTDAGRPAAGRAPAGPVAAAGDRAGADRPAERRSPEPTPPARPAAASTAEPAPPVRPSIDRRGPEPAPPARPAVDRRAPDAAPTSRPVPAAEAPPVPAAAPLDATAVRRVWPEVLAAARQRSRSTAAMLVNATVRAVEGDVLVLSIDAEPLARRLSEPRNTDVIADALHAVLGVRWRVRCDHGAAPPPPPPSRASAARPATPPPRRERVERVERVERAATRPGAGRRPADDGVPLPPEPPDEDLPPDAAQDVPPEDEEAMLAEAAAGPPVAARPQRGPEEAAIELLSTQLGAKTIDRR